MSKPHDELHRLVDALPADHIEAAKKFLRFLITEAEEDTEPLTTAEQQALKRAREQVTRGETISLEDLERELDGEI